jgi:hypothetical protein
MSAPLNVTERLQWLIFGVGIPLACECIAPRALLPPIRGDSRIWSERHLSTAGDFPRPHKRQFSARRAQFYH